MIYQSKSNYAHLSKGLVGSVRSVATEMRLGFEFISRLNKDKTVSIFGSGRFTEDNSHYQQARKLAAMLAKENFTVITGGGPGIMEAANRGATEANGESVGLNIVLPHKQNYNPYVKKGMEFHHFFVRKAMFAAASSYYVYFAGGFGTLDEFFEMINLEHNHKIHQPPLCIAVGKDYWTPLFTWLENDVYKKHQAISGMDFNVVKLVNSPEETLEIIRATERRNWKTNVKIKKSKTLQQQK